MLSSFKFLKFNFEVIALRFRNDSLNNLFGEILFQFTLFLLSAWRSKITKKEKHANEASERKVLAV
jgi:hypothetical protein